MVKDLTRIARLPSPEYSLPLPPALVPPPAQAQSPAPCPPLAAHSAQKAHAPQRAPQPSFFIGQPIAPLIVGADIGIDIPGGRPCVCPISVAFPGRSHRPFECPIRIHASFGRCPGWTAAGALIPASWKGEDLTAACWAEWRVFAPTLPVSNIARGAVVNF